MLKNRKKALFVCMLILMCIFGCDKQELFKTEFVVFGLHNGDAKMMGECIVTSVDGQLALYDNKGTQLKMYKEVNSNWIDVDEENNIIVYGNFNKEIGIVKLDSNYNLLSNEIIMKNENLQIDPTITYVNGLYYLTVTEIQGNVNNADINSENETYIIHFYKSNDLKNWILVSDVLTLQNNLEDIDVFYQNDRFYVCYEKENIDKGNSSVCVISSKDALGNSWNKEIELVSDDCDHEPAAIFINEYGYRLYYSCDKEAIGESYMGGKIYYADFDEEFALVCKDMMVWEDADGGILLYDVQQRNDEMLFLYARNYLTDCDMVLGKLENNN